MNLKTVGTHYQITCSLTKRYCFESVNARKCRIWMRNNNDCGNPIPLRNPTACESSGL